MAITISHEQHQREMVEMARLVAENERLRKLECAVQTAVLAERERCARIAEAHIGSAAARRRQKGQQFKFLPDDVAAEIQAEERGEDIAAEIIARTIRHSQ